MVEVTEDFLERINTSDKISYYLSKYPFDVSNLRLQISLRDTKWNEIKNKGSGTEMLWGISMHQGILMKKI